MFITISPYNRRVNTLAAAPAKIDTYRAINITKNPLYSNKKDVFVKSKKISFGSAEYNRQAAEELINDIANKKVTTNKVIVVVNGNVITKLDVENRIKVFLKLANVQIPESEKEGM